MGFLFVKNKADLSDPFVPSLMCSHYCQNKSQAAWLGLPAVEPATPFPAEHPTGLSGLSPGPAGLPSAPCAPEALFPTAPLHLLCRLSVWGVISNRQNQSFLHQLLLDAPFSSAPSDCVPPLYVWGVIRSLCLACGPETP